MVREYIGARYVPKFMGPYVATQDYEALCVVDNGMGTSYISKVPTPPGTPLTDTNYWFVYGASSGAILNLQNRVDALENNRSPITFNDHASLVVADLPTGAIVTTLGYHAANDGGGGTFVIVDTPDENSLLYYSLTNGKYAEILDDAVVLPRYGGTSVHEMFANAIPFIVRHNEKIVVLPPPNPNHPACDSYVENNKNTYFWTTTAPIVITEDYAYTSFYLYGEISATDSIDCVMKISDPLKPEDLEFITDVRISGWHYNGVTKLVNHALLVEGCARVNFVGTLAAGFAKNSITLGGLNQTNPIEITGNILDVGSCSERVINADVQNGLGCTFVFNNVTMQNILNNTCEGVYISGPVSWSSINNLRITSTNQPCAVGVHLNPNYAYGEHTLTINSARMSAVLPFKLENGACECGSVSLNMDTDDTIAVLTNSAKLVVTLLNARRLGVTIDCSVDAICDIIRTDTPITMVGRNVFVNGFCFGDVKATVIQDSISVDTTNGQLIICHRGTVAHRYNADV